MTRSFPHSPSPPFPPERVGKTGAPKPFAACSSGTVWLLPCWLIRRRQTYTLAFPRSDLAEAHCRDCRNAGVICPAPDRHRNPIKYRRA